MAAMTCNYSLSSSTVLVHAFEVHHYPRSGGTLHSLLTSSSRRYYAPDTTLVSPTTATATTSSSSSTTRLPNIVNIRVQQQTPSPQKIASASRNTRKQQQQVNTADVFSPSQTNTKNNNSVPNKRRRRRRKHPLAPTAASAEQLRQALLREAHAAAASSSSAQQQQQQQQQQRKKSMLRATHQHARVVATPVGSFGTSSYSIKTDDAAVSAETFPPSRLLTKQEEIDYALQLKHMREAIRIRDGLVKQQEGLYIHPTEHEWARAMKLASVLELRKIMMDGQQARSILCENNVGLVTSIAKRHYKSLKHATEAGNGLGAILTLNDMIQEGNLGLMEAAERFDPSKGFRFSTYATWWIRQRILRAISDSSRTIRLPAHVHGMLHKIRRAKVELQATSGKAPTLEQLSAKLGVPAEKLQRYESSSRNVMSLEARMVPSTLKQDLRTLGDTLASDAPTPLQDAETHALASDIRHVMETALSEVERAVVQWRFGFCCDDGKPRTVAQTAQALGLTVDRVRLIEARALNKLRSPQKNYKLRTYVGGHGPARATARVPRLQNSPGSGEKASTAGDLGMHTPLTRAWRRGATRTSVVANGSSAKSSDMDQEVSSGKASKPRRKRKSPPSIRKSSSSVVDDAIPPTSPPATSPSNRPDRMWFF